MHIWLRVAVPPLDEIVSAWPTECVRMFLSRAQFPLHRLAINLGREPIKATGAVFHSREPSEEATPRGERRRAVAARFINVADNYGNEIGWTAREGAGWLARRHGEPAGPDSPEPQELELAGALHGLLATSRPL